MATKGGREKIKLESTAGTGHFYTTSKNKKTHAREDVDHEVRPQGSQARGVQGNQAEVIFCLGHPGNPLHAAGFFLPGGPTIGPIESGRTILEAWQSGRLHRS
jgi:hypothetical protein